MKKDSLAKYGHALWDIFVLFQSSTRAKSRNFTLAYVFQKAKLYAAAAVTIWILRLNNFPDSILR